MKLILGFFLLLSGVVTATQVEDTLYINRGMFTAFNGEQFDYMAFNTTASFENENKRFLLGLSDTLNLRVINNDLVEHGFSIKNSSISETIPAGDSISIQFSSLVQKAFIYHDHLNEFTYLGLGGMLVFTEHTHNFFWNMKEHQQAWNISIANGGTEDWNNYYPDYFTINGRSNPDIQTDVNAKVVGNVGDTIHIYMVNTGKSIHSIHYHGYHAEIIQSTKFPNQIGRSKDTFPVYGLEIVVLELVPDQPGEYPVHDHNLVAVSGGGMYPNGMLLTLLIGE
jgi:hypothetical protein